MFLTGARAGCEVDLRYPSITSTLIDSESQNEIAMSNQFPKLHNAMWPGLVGKGPDSEPPIDLDTMLLLTAEAEVDGTRFDGVDIFLSEPHTPIDASDDELRQLADKVGGMNLAIG